MAKYERFEDMPVWNDGKNLAVEIHRLTHQDPWNGYHSLRNQMCRSSLSIPSNIAEGFERGTTRELRQFLYVARGSNGELRTQIEVAFEIDLLKQTTYQSLLERTRSVSRQLTGFISSLTRRVQK